LNILVSASVARLTRMRMASAVRPGSSKPNSSALSA
jgi:hypothetical protein